MVLALLGGNTTFLPKTFFPGSPPGGSGVTSRLALGSDASFSLTSRAHVLAARLRPFPQHSSHQAIKSSPGLGTQPPTTLVLQLFFFLLFFSFCVCFREPPPHPPPPPPTPPPPPHPPQLFFSLRFFLKPQAWPRLPLLISVLTVY